VSLAFTHLTSPLPFFPCILFSFRQVKAGHRIDVTTTIKGTTIHSTEESEDMYASIDAVSDRLVRYF
jgi:ribosomal subunit interface protein